MSRAFGPGLGGGYRGPTEASQDGSERAAQLISTRLWGLTVLSLATGFGWSEARS